MPLVPAPSMPLLGTYRFPSSAATSAVITIPPCEILNIHFNVSGYTGSAIASLRFNGDTAVGNYSSSYGILTSTTKTNVLATFGGFKLGQNAVTSQRSGQVTIYNVNGTSHPITCLSTTHSATSAAPVTSVGSGMWISGANAQITTIQMIQDASASMTAGTSFAIYGMNP